jgi:hypothetical protein
MGKKSRFESHPTLTLAAILVTSTFAALLVCEIALRLLVRYDPGYYSSVRVRGEQVTYPYGTIKFNSLGFADDEFVLDGEEPRVGYIGDSVTFGVGAGHGHRITELLETYYPNFQHLNLGMLGKSIDEEQARGVLRYVEDFGLDAVVYLLNLNDILPDPEETNAQLGRPRPAKRLIRKYLDPLRGRLYLYTVVRNAAKNFLLRRGLGHTGVAAFEFYPERYEGVIRETTERINRLGEALRERGIEFIVVLLPYEMQISAEAERRYRDLGVRWGEDFIRLGTQRRLQEHLRGVRSLDAAGAFLDTSDPEASRAANGVGEYFVHDRGGRMDWNHPNRKGHRRIADFLVERAILGQPRRQVTGRPAVVVPADAGS